MLGTLAGRAPSLTASMPVGSDMSSNKSATETPRKRSTREDVRRSQAALKIVRPLHHEVSVWQVEIARLITHAQRVRARHEHDSAAQQRIVALERTIQDVRQRLARELGTVPEEVRDHGRVVDVRRAIDSALAGLDQAHHLLN